MHYGNYAQIDMDVPQAVGPKWKGPYFKANVTVPLGLELTIEQKLEVDATLLDDIAGTSASASFANTVDLYVDSPVPSLPLLANDGEDYSDPERTRSSILVKSFTPAHGPGVVAADPGFSIVGGGEWLTNTGSLLSSSAPMPNSADSNTGLRWTASDQPLSSEGGRPPIPQPGISIYGLELRDPSKRFETIVVHSSSPAGRWGRPIATAIVPDGYSLASGGCAVKPSNPASSTGTPNSRVVVTPPETLVGSYPEVNANGRQMWVCESPARSGFSSGAVTAYAVGIKDTLSSQPPPMKIFQVTGRAPITELSVETGGLELEGFIISGCGARVVPNWPISSGSSRLQKPSISRDRQLLTAMFPVTTPGSATAQAVGCRVISSDYGAVAPDYLTDYPDHLTVYVVGLLLDRPKISSITRQAKSGSLVTLSGSWFTPGMKVRFTSQNKTFIEAPATVPADSVHEANVTVPAGLPIGYYYVDVSLGGIVGSALTPPMGADDGPVSFTVLP
jgi:hypothetical protein